MIDFVKFAQDVHDNAVSHGWWESQRPASEIMALIHSEWSEALEEYRADRPMVWHKCKGGLNQIACDGHLNMNDYGFCMKPEYSKCNFYDRKPEGIAVELIDGCIRILDYLAHEKVLFSACEVENTMAVHKRKNQYTLPELVSMLHWATANSIDYDFIRENYPEKIRFGFLLDCIGMVFNWIEANGGDPVKIIRDKHEYNKSRPYRHGGKKA